MSTAMLSQDRGINKKGNGVDFLRFQEKEIQRQHVENMEPYMNTRENLFYTRLRDDIAEKANRITKMKKKELEAQNEKMYGKLIHILRNERSSICKTRERAGP